MGWTSTPPGRLHRVRRVPLWDRPLRASSVPTDFDLDDPMRRVGIVDLPPSGVQVVTMGDSFGGAITDARGVVLGLGDQGQLGR